MYHNTIHRSLHSRELWRANMLSIYQSSTFNHHIQRTIRKLTCCSKCFRVHIPYLLAMGVQHLVSLHLLHRSVNKQDERSDPLSIKQLCKTPKNHYVSTSLSPRKSSHQTSLPCLNKRIKGSYQRVSLPQSALKPNPERDLAISAETVCKWNKSQGWDGGLVKGIAWGSDFPTECSKL